MDDVTKAGEFMAPGVAVLVQNMKPNRMYLIQCFSNHARKMCPEKLQSSEDLYISVQGAFTAEVGIKTK